MKRVCFYHADCPDGFGAAWAVWRAWGEQGAFQPHHHDDPLDAAAAPGGLLVFVDMAPQAEALERLAQDAGRLVVLDHHVSSMESYASRKGLLEEMRRGGHHVEFDLEHSGAVLAWRYFHGGAPVPALLQYVEDLDLWSHRLPHSAEVNAAISSYPRRFEDWERLSQAPVEQLAGEGTPILRALRVETERTLSFAHPVSLDGKPIEAVNARQQRNSIGHELAERAAFGIPWGLVYRLSGDRVDVSLYSVGDLDVARIAARFGGGGHRNAAGFSVGLREWLDRFVDGRPPTG
jgi:oligoribonuclease NrnB/cAMP/cGMP phosphodiesterase (DHH superfamily)